MEMDREKLQKELEELKKKAKITPEEEKIMDDFAKTVLEEELKDMLPRGIKLIADVYKRGYMAGNNKADDDEVIKDMGELILLIGEYTSYVSSGVFSVALRGLDKFGKK